MAKAGKNKAKDVETDKVEKPTQIDKMSLQELKALAYDLIGAHERNLAAWKRVNEQIALRRN